MKPADAVLLAIGATAMVTTVLGEGLVSIVLLGCGLLGLARATSPRLAIPLVLGLLLAGFLINLWSLLPEALSPDLDFREQRELTYTLPIRLGSAVFDLLLVAAALLAARRVGRGLGVMTAVFAMLAMLALLAHAGIEALMNESDLADERSGRAGILFVLDSTSEGSWVAARALTAAIWLAIPFAHALPTARAPKRALAWMGAAGAALVAATIASAPVEVGHELEWGELLYLVTVMIGWVVLAVGLLGLRQELGKLAIAGTAIILLQVLCCPVTGWAFERVIDNHFYVLVYTPALFGLLGIAVASLPTRDGAMRPLRFVVVGLSAIAILGVLLGAAGYFLASDLVEMRIDNPFEPMSRYTRLGATYALVGFAVLIGLLARRRPDDPTEPAAHPQPPMHSHSEISVHDASQPAFSSS